MGLLQDGRVEVGDRRGLDEIPRMGADYKWRSEQCSGGVLVSLHPKLLQAPAQPMVLSYFRQNL